MNFINDPEMMNMKNKNIVTRQNIEIEDKRLFNLSRTLAKPQKSQTITITYMHCVMPLMQTLQNILRLYSELIKVRKY